MKLKVRCTTCKKTYVPTDREMEEARDFGCFMSPCCMAPATVEGASSK